MRPSGQPDALLAIWLKSRHVGKFGLTGAFRDDIDDIFGSGVFIVLNVTIVTFAGVADR